MWSPAAAHKPPGSLSEGLPAPSLPGHCLVSAQRPVWASSNEQEQVTTSAQCPATIPWSLLARRQVLSTALRPCCLCPSPPDPFPPILPELSRHTLHRGLPTGCSFYLEAPGLVASFRSAQMASPEEDPSRCLSLKSSLVHPLTLL